MGREARARRAEPTPRRRHPDYWKVKAMFFETQAARAAAAAKFETVLRAAGLDPTRDYDLDDATESITPRPAPAPPTKEPA